MFKEVNCRTHTSYASVDFSQDTSRSISLYPAFRKESNGVDPSVMIRKEEGESLAQNPLNLPEYTYQELPEFPYQRLITSGGYRLSSWIGSETQDLHHFHLTLYPRGVEDTKEVLDEYLDAYPEDARNELTRQIAMLMPEFILTSGDGHRLRDTIAKEDILTISPRGSKKSIVREDAECIYDLNSDPGFFEYTIGSQMSIRGERQGVKLTAGVIVRVDSLRTMEEEVFTRIQEGVFEEGVVRKVVSPFVRATWF